MAYIVKQIDRIKPTFTPIIEPISADEDLPSLTLTMYVQKVSIAGPNGTIELAHTQVFALLMDATPWLQGGDGDNLSTIQGSTPNMVVAAANHGVTRGPSKTARSQAQMRRGINRVDPNYTDMTLTIPADGCLKLPEISMVLAKLHVVLTVNSATVTMSRKQIADILTNLSPWCYTKPDPGTPKGRIFNMNPSKSV